MDGPNNPRLTSRDRVLQQRPEQACFAYLAEKRSCTQPCCPEQTHTAMMAMRFLRAETT